MDLTQLIFKNSWKQYRISILILVRRKQLIFSIVSTEITEVQSQLMNSLMEWSVLFLKIERNLFRRHLTTSIKMAARDLKWVKLKKCLKVKDIQSASQEKRLQSNAKLSSWTFSKLTIMLQQGFLIKLQSVFKTSCNIIKFLALSSWEILSSETS